MPLPPSPASRNATTPRTKNSSSNPATGNTSPASAPSPVRTTTWKGSFHLPTTPATSSGAYPSGKPCRARATGNSTVPAAGTAPTRSAVPMTAPAWTGNGKRAAPPSPAWALPAIRSSPARNPGRNAMCASFSPAANTWMTPWKTGSRTTPAPTSSSSPPTSTTCF